MASVLDVTDATNDAGEPVVLAEIHGAVLTIRLNRPERLNSLSTKVWGGIHRALTAADTDDAVRCVVLSGTGRAFSAGGDLNDGGMNLSDAYGWYQFHESRGGGQVRAFRKPIVAAVNGLCYGAGLFLATACDLVVAAESARFSMIEARMGNGGGHNLPFLVGAQWAKFLMYTGEIISARRAKEIGLILETVPDDELTARIDKLAGRIAAMPRYATMLEKRQINGTLDMMGWAANQVFAQSHGAVIESMAEVADAPDGRLLRDIYAKEGFQAFKEARDAAHREPWLID